MVLLLAKVLDYFNLNVSCTLVHKHVSQRDKLSLCRTFIASSIANTIKNICEGISSRNLEGALSPGGTGPVLVWSPHFKRLKPSHLLLFAPLHQKKQKKPEKPKPWSWISVTTLIPVAHKLHASSQVEWMSIYWFLLYLSLFPSLYSQRVHPPVAFCLCSQPSDFLSVILPLLLVRRCHCFFARLNSVVGFYSKTTGTGLKKMSFSLWFFPGLPLHLVTAWKKKRRYFWYEHIVLYFVRPTAAVKDFISASAVFCLSIVANQLNVLAPSCSVCIVWLDLL